MAVLCSFIPDGVLQIEFCIEEYSTGRFQQGIFDELLNKDRYETHLKDLTEWAALKPTVTTVFLQCMHDTCRASTGAALVKTTGRMTDAARAKALAQLEAMDIDGDGGDDNDSDDDEIHDTIDGLYFIFNAQWERVFQKLPGQPDNKLTNLVAYGRGKHGLILAHAWAAHYATVVTPAERDLIQLRVQSLLKLITNSIPVISLTAGSDNFGSAADDKGNESVDGDDEGQGKKRKKSSQARAKPKKKAKTAVVDSGDETDQPGNKPTAKATSKTPTDTSSSEDSDSSSSCSEVDTVDKRASLKLTWALSQFRKPTKATSKGAEVWKHLCRYCPPRTKGIDEWAQETEKIKATSNFITHADECQLRPAAQSWEQFQAVRERQRKGLPPLPVDSDPSPWNARQEMVVDFVKRGVENPAKVVTNSSYRRHLVEAIVEDDLAFSIAEKGGTAVYDLSNGRWKSTPVPAVNSCVQIYGMCRELNPSGILGVKVESIALNLGANANTTLTPAPSTSSDTPKKRRKFSPEPEEFPEVSQSAQRAVAASGTSSATAGTSGSHTVSGAQGSSHCTLPAPMHSHGGPFVPGSFNPMGFYHHGESAPFSMHPPFASFVPSGPSAFPGTALSGSSTEGIARNAYP
ncbi:hypothetical protein MVEN_01138500 [Mycena venus]|uniref:Uncharacterized protein n=1 Tax=Mycena venus TaxID=2733690 RepID=A0A8H7D034_9AGAR|nr:hypothetical protein MVEN_01138500 [Mycena venus]